MTEYQPQPHVENRAEVKPKKKKRVFMWVFLAVQALFLIWIISGIAGNASNNSCNGLDQQSCDAATAVGTGIGVALIIGLWIAVDFILGVTYLIVRAARRD